MYWMEGRSKFSAKGLLVYGSAGLASCSFNSLALYTIALTGRLMTFSALAMASNSPVGGVADDAHVHIAIGALFATRDEPNMKAI